jgi:hypothetical protein
MSDSRGVVTPLAFLEAYSGRESDVGFLDVSRSAPGINAARLFYALLAHRD